MFKSKCYCCHKQIIDPSALLFAPQEIIEFNDERFPAGMVQKYEICADCFLDIMSYVKIDKISKT